MAKKENTTPTKTKRLKVRKIVKIFVSVFLVSLAILVGTFAAYSYDYRAKILPNIFIVEHKLAGKSKNDLEKLLADYEKNYKDEKIKLVKDDKNWEMSFKDLDWKPKNDQMLNDIYGFGHNQRFKYNIIPLIRCLFGKKEFKYDFDFNQKIIEDWLGQVNGEVGTPKQETNLQIKDGEAKVIEPKKGEIIDEFKLKKMILDRLALKEKGEIKLQLITDEPIISVAEAEALKDKAKELTKDDVELVGPDGATTLSSKTLGNSLELKREVKEKDTFLEPQREYGPVYVSFNRDKLRAFLEKESDKLNKEPIDARLEYANGKVEVREASQVGQTIKMDEALDKIISELEKGGAKEIELPWQTEEAAISAKTADDITKYGIKELIGTATTDFSRSPQNRIHNIQNGVKYISGSLVKKGEEFSTLKRLGSIDASQGYLQELVIKENETVPEFGGGLCQVSTTLFRSAMNAGLKITERKNHSYRVSYYEPPVGMDATIYSPHPDLRFINDTPAYILIQGRVEGVKITFDIFGTKDGREVEISDPEVYDITPPPPSVYIDDPSLAPGEEVRIDRAHNGAKAVFTYKVIKGDKVISQEKFFSSYVPWAAKYRRGPQAEGQSEGSGG